MLSQDVVKVLEFVKELGEKAATREEMFEILDIVLKPFDQEDVIRSVRHSQEGKELECSGCDKPVLDGFQFCPWCGMSYTIEEAVEEELCECGACGKDIAADATKCSHCGVEFEEVVG